MEVRSARGSYLVGKRVADTEMYRLYFCTHEGTNRQCLFQIATDVVHNGALDRVAFFLRMLKSHADQLEAEYSGVKTDKRVMLNYDLGFPELVDSFTSEEQGGRRINILAFRKVEDVSHMVPIGNIIYKDHRRIDLRTSAWIMGKTLKLLLFAHSVDVSVGQVDVTNILIEPDQHYVLIFDWSDATVHPEGVSADIRCSEIAQAAKAVIAVLGGDFGSRTIPNDGEKMHDIYAGFLFDLADGCQSDARRAHERFYELIDRIWERKFYPYTSYPL